MWKRFWEARKWRLSAAWPGGDLWTCELQQWFVKGVAVGGSTI
ncbi:hypothetical protein TIFTF001_015389 [Ficus carica]|uniref:Uncharacterized protein n=1 Tax=Ficus carica TaxID=3494 RepID=A0AA88A5Q1_FICCA|nr:hypothetical protein TIFTF001_015389 [Ficus carica]